MFVCIIRQNIGVNVQFESLLREIFIQIHTYKPIINVFVYTS